MSYIFKLSLSTVFTKKCAEIMMSPPSLRRDCQLCLISNKYQVIKYFNIFWSGGWSPVTSWTAGEQ